MGKQKKRSVASKRRSSDSAGKKNKSPSFHGIIRHAPDFGTKMAALTAVLHSLDQHESSANLLRNTTLWQAIREQVVGGNSNESLELSITAASCLTRYLELMAEEETEEEDWQLSSGWLVLVTSRIQQVLPQVQQSPSTLVLMLLGQCLQCLVLLLENSPFFSTQTESNYADWLFPLLEASRVNSSPELSEEWSGVALWSIRAVYSLWADHDDYDHHVSWMLSKTVPGVVTEATFPWQYILCKLALDHSSTANHVANDHMIRLYAVGAFVAAYQMTSNCLAMSPHPPEPLPVLHQTLAHSLPEVLAVLARYLRVWQTDILRYDSTLADAATPTWAQWMVRLVRAHEMEKQQAQDAQMEHDILLEQQQKRSRLDSLPGDKPKLVDRKKLHSVKGEVRAWSNSQILPSRHHPFRLPMYKMNSWILCDRFK
jgi:hypothetical protein